MTDMENVTVLLTKTKLPVIGAVVSNPSSPNAYFVTLHLIRDPDGRKIPSGLEIDHARRMFINSGYVVDFIIVDEDAQHIEESLRSGLLGSFPDDVRNSFLSLSGERPRVWVEFKRRPDAETKRRLEAHLLRFSGTFSLPTLSMVTIGDADLATNTEILNMIRELAPVGLQTLARELASRGYDVPSSDWVHRRLNGLLKSNFLLLRRNGTYVLTMDALKRLGTRKGRRSPDVRRFLALARRGE